MWIYPHLGGWGQNPQKNKKNMPLKSILDHLKAFLPFTPQLPPLPITANHHHNPPPSDTHQSQAPLMPRTTSIRHCTTHHGGRRQWGASVVSGGDGWWQLMAPVGGSGSG